MGKAMTDFSVTKREKLPGTCVKEACPVLTYCGLQILSSGMVSLSMHCTVIKCYLKSKMVRSYSVGLSCVHPQRTVVFFKIYSST